MTSVILLIPESYKNAANAAAQQISPNAAPVTFGGFGLSASGQAPATHYWAAGEVDGLVADIEALWRSHFPDGYLEEYNPDAAPLRPAQLLQERGLKQVRFVV